MKFKSTISIEKFLDFSHDKKMDFLFLLLKEIELSHPNNFTELKDLLIRLLQSSSNLIPFELIAKVTEAQSHREILNICIPLFSDQFYNEKDFHFLPDHKIEIRKNDSDHNKIQFPIVLILHELRSAFNVGSIIRTAECFGIEKLYFTSYTPLPDHPKVILTSMNSSLKINWEKKEDLFQLIKDLKNEDYDIFALETADPSVKINHYPFQKKCAVILGNEALGIDQSILNQVDTILEIPLYGWKNSLNVATAAAIACYEITKQLSKS
jgi:tRNA G18 (ribose-2'-O)-methylase SpoU